jgi:hypothetical protein
MPRRSGIMVAKIGLDHEEGRRQHHCLLVEIDAGEVTAHLWELGEKRVVEEPDDRFFCASNRPTLCLIFIKLPGSLAALPLGD